jgi:hypothetical protein
VRDGGALSRSCIYDARLSRKHGKLTFCVYLLIRHYGGAGYRVLAAHAVSALIPSIEHDPIGVFITPVGFQNSAIGADLLFQAARSYSLISPPSTGRRLIRWSRSGAG